MPFARRILRRKARGVRFEDTRVRLGRSRRAQRRGRRLARHRRNGLGRQAMVERAPGWGHHHPKTIARHGRRATFRDVSLQPRVVLVPERVLHRRGEGSRSRARAFAVARGERGLLASTPAVHDVSNRGRRRPDARALGAVVERSNSKCRNVLLQSGGGV